MSDNVDDTCLKGYCTLLPKVELHAHLNGSISDSTIARLIERKQQQEKDWKPPADWGVTIAAGQQRSLEHCFVIFRLLHELCTTEDVAYLVTCEVIREFAADNVKYLELRTTPRDVPDTGMTKRSYIDAVLKAIKDVSVEEDIMVRLLLAVDRRVSVAEAEAVVTMAATLMEETKGIVCGVDLSGDPSKGNIATFIPVFKKAKEKGLKLALHLAEASYNVEESSEFMESVLPDRIGHGTFLQDKQSLVETVIKHKIPIEICLTSNLKSNTVKKLCEHHLSFWRDNKHPIVIATDDKGVFSTSLSEEYYLAAQTCSLDKQQLYQLSGQSIEYIFAGEEVKEKLRCLWRITKQSLLDT